MTPQCETDVPNSLFSIAKFLLTDDTEPIKDTVTQKKSETLNLLYKILDTLDSKTSHLLRVNGVILAVLGILIGLTARAQGGAGWTVSSIVLLLAALVPTTACSMAVWIFQVKWPFLQHDDVYDEFVSLARECDSRTRWHTRIWRTSVASIFSLLVSLLTATFWI